MPNNPNNPGSNNPIPPPWLAKLNSLNDQVDSAISHAAHNPLQSPVPLTVTTPTEALIEFKTDSTFGKLGPTSTLYDHAVADAVTQTEKDMTNVVKGQAIQIATGTKEIKPNVVIGSPIEFDASLFAQAIGRGSRVDSEVEVGLIISEEYKEHLISGERVELHQEFSSPIVEDALLSDAEIPSLPGNWKPAIEVDLPPVYDPESKPLVQPAAEVVEYVSADTNQPRISEEQYYESIVAVIGQSNPTEAKLIERLRLFQSQYVGLITSPEQAIDHIARCRAAGVPVGGSDAVELSAQSTSLKHKDYIDRRYAPYRAKKVAVEAARVAWKSAIADRENMIKQWDEFVKWHHDNYNRIRGLPATCFLVEEGK